MKSLHIDDLDIVGFGGIRERILIMEPTQFSGRVRDDTWPGFLDLTYFAHAYFKPFGQTGLHYHDNVDIISVITRGEIHHQGTLGDGDVIRQGQVLVQSAGPKSFRHNEINGADDIQGMIQIWMRPSEATAKHQQHRVIDLHEDTETEIYGGQSDFSSATRLSILPLADQTRHFIEPDSLLYLYQGEAAVIDTNGISHSFTRGQLIRAHQVTLSGTGLCIWVCATESQSVL